MRIAQLTDCYTPVLNGVTNFVRAHKAELERIGHRAPVFTVGHLSYPDAERDVVRSQGWRLGATGYYAALGYAPQAQAVLATCDLLHVHHPFLAGRLALRYGRRFGRPVVYTNHTRLDLYAGAFVPAGLKQVVRGWLRWYMPRFTARCDLVIAPSDGLARVMRADWGVTVPVVVVPNGVDLDRFWARSYRTCRADLGVPDGGPLTVYTGRLSPEKNLDFLLRAFALVAATDAGARLLLVGDGPRAAALRKRVGALGLTEHVTFAGAVPHAQVPAYLAAADIYASASVSEGHPLALIEALAAGLPTLGITSPGVADTIQDGVNGLLTGPDLTAFANAWRRLLTDAALRARLAEGARRSSERYSIQATTARLVDRYAQLLEEKRR